METRSAVSGASGAGMWTCSGWTQKPCRDYSIILPQYHPQPHFNWVISPKPHSYRSSGISLVVQWLRNLPMQVPSLVWELISHVLWSGSACAPRHSGAWAPQILRLRAESPHSATGEAMAPQWEGALHPERNPHLQLEKVCAQQWRPRAARNKYIRKNSGVTTDSGQVKHGLAKF